MEYRFVTGFNGSKLVYTDKHLYNLKCNRPNGNVEYICYQKILNKRTKEEKTQSDGSQSQGMEELEMNLAEQDTGCQPNCGARVIIKPDKTLSRNKIQHTNHNNHEIIVADLESIDEMEKVCTFIRENIPLSAHKVSPKDIFLQVMAK